MNAATPTPLVRQFRYEALRTSKAYDDFLDAPYMKVKPKIDEI